jgi:hypothetical protein
VAYRQDVSRFIVGSDPPHLGVGGPTGNAIPPPDPARADATDREGHRPVDDAAQPMARQPDIPSPAFAHNGRATVTIGGTPRRCRHLR